MAGHTHSFSEIYESCFAAVWRYARGHGIRGEDLEDVVQEVFVVVHQKLPTFEGRSSVRTWVVGIAVNVVRAFRRRPATRPLGEPLLDVKDPASNRPLPSADAEAAEDARFLLQFMDSLPEPQREAFLLCELEEMSAVEAAALLGVNENTLRTRLRAARTALNVAVAQR